MKNIQKQTKHGACAINCLANLFQDKNILKYAEDEKYIPSGYIELSKILEAEGFDAVVDPIIFMPDTKTPIPKTFVNKMINAWVDEFKTTGSLKDGFIPFFIVAQYGNEEETLHCTLLIWKDEELYFSDPRFDEFEKLDNLYNIYSKFEHVSQIWMVGKDGGKCSIKNNILE